MTEKEGLVAQALKCVLGNFELSIDQLRITAGTIAAIVGPTGAGKTTLLRSLSGLCRDASGDISWDGTDTSANSIALDARRRLTLVPQRPCLLSGSVVWNVGYGLRCRRTQGARDAAMEMLSRLGIDDLALRDIRSLSVGQTQLVALARALVIRPQLLLLDEPTSNLDPANVALVENILLEFRKEFQTTVAWVTHNLFQAQRVSDQTLFLWDGRLVESNQTAKFFQAPDDPRSADFVNGKLIY